MRITTLLKLFKKNKTSTGYTLTELLIGASISVVVIGAAGMGLINLLQGNKTSTVQAERRTEVNRALEFISDEVKKAKAIETNPTSVLPAGFDPTGKQVVLALDLPNLGQVNPNDRVIYYVAPKPNNDTTWLGPNVIYRYGPPISDQGDYTNGAWGSARPLVDRIDDQTISPSSCTGTAISAKGFAACVNSNKKIAQLYISGTYTGSNEKYQANTQVYARAQANTLVGNSSSKNFNSPPTNPLNPNGQSRIYRIKSLASSMGCNPIGDPCNMTITFKKKSNNQDIAPVIKPNGDMEFEVNEEFYVVVTPSTTGLNNPYTSAEQNNTQPVASTNTNQVILLGDGYDPPQIPAWNPENNSSKFQSLATILGTQNLIQNNKITLPEKQYLLAFEIGQSDPNHPGFDMQDKVLLITLQ